MADVLNTSTLEMRASVNESQSPYTDTPWIVITRDQFNLWSTIPQIYRKWNGVAIEEMTQPEKDAVDAALLQQQLDSITQQLDQANDLLRAVVKLLVAEFNRHADKTNALLDAIDASGSLAQLKTAAASIPNHQTRTLAQLRAAIRAELGS